MPIKWEIRLIQVSVPLLLAYPYIRKCFSPNDDAC